MTNNYLKYLSKEDHLQHAVITYLRLAYPGCKIHHSPNEGKRTLFEQFKFKYIGGEAGFPDLLIIHKGKMIAIELKVAPNKATTNQKSWIESLSEIMPAAVCTGFEQAKEFIDNNLK